MKNVSKAILALVIIVALIGAYSNQTTASATSSSPATWQFGQDTWSQNSWGSNSWAHHHQQATVTVVSTQSNQHHAGWSDGGGYYGGGYYGQYPYYNQNYNPYCPIGASYCSNQCCAYGNTYCPNQYCPIYNPQNPYWTPNNNYCVNSPYCYAYTTQVQNPPTSTAQGPQVIIQNITVTQSVTATPTPTLQVTMVTATIPSSDQMAGFGIIAASVVVSSMATIAVMLFMSVWRKNKGQPAQTPTFRGQPQQQYPFQSMQDARADKFCRRCGVRLSNDSLYCSVCGTQAI